MRSVITWNAQNATAYNESINSQCGMHNDSEFQSFNIAVAYILARGVSHSNTIIIYYYRNPQLVIAIYLYVYGNKTRTKCGCVFVDVEERPITRCTSQLAVNSSECEI